jgi:fructose/tagatose bisphosphate aldolase
MSQSRLVNIVDMLKKAHDGKYAVAHININNLE